MQQRLAGDFQARIELRLHDEGDALNVYREVLKQRGEWPIK